MSIGSYPNVDLEVIGRGDDNIPIRFNEFIELVKENYRLSRCFAIQRGGNPLLFLPGQDTFLDILLGCVYSGLGAYLN